MRIAISQEEYSFFKNSIGKIIENLDSGEKFEVISWQPYSEGVFKLVGFEDTYKYTYLSERFISSSNLLNWKILSYKEGEVL